MGETVFLQTIEENPDSPEALAVAINMIRELYRIAYREQGYEMAQLTINRKDTGAIVYSQG